MLTKLIEWILFRPPNRSSSSKPEGNYITRFIETDDARIHCLHFQTSSSEPSSPERSMTLLYSHGNAEDLTICHHNLAILSRSVGVDIFAYDYCGYGHSKSNTGGRPTEQQVYRDADAAYEELTLKMGIPPSRIILVGRSLGGGPACYLASKHHSKIGGLILMSTFTSAFGAVRCRFLQCFSTLRDPFPNEKFLEDVGDCPVLLLHGARDLMVDFSCSRHLAEVVERAQSVYKTKSVLECVWFDKCGHNDIGGKEIKKLVFVIRGFIDRITSPGSPLSSTEDSIHTERESRIAR